MTPKKKIIVGGVVAVVAIGVVAIFKADHHGRFGGGWYMKHAGYGGGHHGAGMGMRVHKLFDEVDADKDGKITDDELTRYRVARVGKADANGDGSLQMDEFQSIWMDVMRPRMVDHFQFLDDDGDGTISEAEITTPLSMITTRLDRNDDGVITRNELKRKHRGWYKRGHDDGDDDDDQKGN